jgi:hypothetical protein
MATSQGNPAPEKKPEESKALVVAPKRALTTLLEMGAVPQEYLRQMVEAEVARDVFDQDWKLARVFAMSGVFADLQKADPDAAIATAMAKIRLGRSWGINEADAMQFIFFTNGRPAVMNELFAAKMRDAGLDWDVEWHWDQPDPKKRRACVGCTLWLKRWDDAQKKSIPVLDRNGQQISESFTKDDADTALIWEKQRQIKLSEKWNFVSWARDMYYWRALSRLRRFHATNVLRGAVTAVEAEAMEPAPTRVESPKTIKASVDISQFRPNLTEGNRGHDAAMPVAETTKPEEEPKTEEKPQEHKETVPESLWRAVDESAARQEQKQPIPQEQHSQQAPVEEKRESTLRAGPPPNLPNLDDWPEDTGSSEWYLIRGVHYLYSNETGNYQRWEGPQQQQQQPAQPTKAQVSARRGRNPGALFGEGDK